MFNVAFVLIFTDHIMANLTDSSLNYAYTEADPDRHGCRTINVFTAYDLHYPPQHQGSD